MKVALVAPPWLPVPPVAYGGTELVVDTLARGLVAAGHEVALFTTGDSTCPVERHWVYGRARADAMQSVTVELRHLVHAYTRLDDADIVHDHTVAGPLLSAGFDAPPVVTTNHGPFTDDAKALYLALGGSVPIVAISRHQASTAGPVAVARVIHHGLSVERYPFGTGAGGYVLFLGRVSPDKGVRQAIEVARRAGRPLVIAAKLREPVEHEYFRTEIAPLLDDDVRFVGEVGGERKLGLLAGARALVNPIRWDEPFGLCMAEALACGTPVVASPRGAAPEIVDDGVTGFLCGDEDAMAAALRDGVSRLDRAACRAAVIERFSEERMARDHVDLYEDVLAGRDLRPFTPEAAERTIVP
jgi:glycosyltransferase involved in cell wall biosynthesis